MAPQTPTVKSNPSAQFGQGQAQARVDASLEGAQALPGAEVLALARQVGFDLAGTAIAEPLDPSPLKDWLAKGFHADLDWMARDIEVRLDVTKLFPPARTVLALACNYWSDDHPSTIARYARGRDYHWTFRDRLRNLRRLLKAKWPWVADYGSVDANPVMEKVWAVKAGLGAIGKNGCLITRSHGSWVLLAVMVLNADMDFYTGETGASVVWDPCGPCRRCLLACPTGALPGDRSVDARKCLSYQTIENEGPAPLELRPAFGEGSFGCDICQEVCPHNRTPLAAGERFRPRPVSELTLEALAALTPADWERFSRGTPLVRAGYDGIRRNAAYALGALRMSTAAPTLERLAQDANPLGAEAASWALADLGSAPSPGY